MTTPSSSSAFRSQNGPVRSVEHKHKNRVAGTYQLGRLRRGISSSKIQALHKRNVAHQLEFLPSCIKQAQNWPTSSSTLLTSKWHSLSHQIPEYHVSAEPRRSSGSTHRTPMHLIVWRHLNTATHSRRRRVSHLSKEIYQRSIRVFRIVFCVDHTQVDVHGPKDLHEIVRFKYGRIHPGPLPQSVL